MKIKNRNISLLLLAVLTAGSISCNKLLDVPPQNELTLSQFWLSKEQALAAIGGIYSTAGSSSGSSATNVSPMECYIYWGEIRGELLMSNPGRLAATEAPKENVDNFVPDPNDATTKFTVFYKIINLANQAIKHIPEVPPKDPSFTQTLADQYIGEAYFLRAFSYFWLVRTFKEVPLVLVPSETDNQDYNIPKSPPDVILDQIIKDLEIAKNTLPEWYDNSNYARCRATRWTALTMQADAYLWRAALSNNAAVNRDTYQKVIDNCDAVINSARYYLLAKANIGTIFSNGRTEESIFETYSNSKLNNQTNNLYTWFNQNLYFVATPLADGIFVDNPGYLQHSATNYSITKYNKNTKDAIWNFYRYAEVLLMKAEAKAHIYKDDEVNLNEALDLINQLRQRAFGNTTFDKAAGSTTLDLDNVILDQRGREFLGEGKRWFELVRFASRDNFAHPELLTGRILAAYSGGTQVLMNLRISDPLSWYLPLNAAALSSNPELIQNPYYE